MSRPLKPGSKPVKSSSSAKSVNSWQVPEASGPLRPHITHPPADHPLPVVHTP